MCRLLAAFISGGRCYRRVDLAEDMEGTERRLPLRPHHGSHTMSQHRFYNMYSERVGAGIARWI
jgi:hypothetical protein